MGACRSLSPPCILAAGSGLLVLLAVAEGRLEPFIPAAVSIVSLAVALQETYGRASAGLAVGILGSWVSSIAYSQTDFQMLIPIGITLGFAGASAAAIGGGLIAGLAGFAASYAPLIIYFSWTKSAAVVYSLGFIILGGALASLYSKRAHPLLLSPLAVFLAPLGAQSLVALSLLVYLAVMASSLPGWRVCPFSVDSGMILLGLGVGGLGALVMSFHPSLSDQALGLYSLGLLLVLAGTLTPSSHLRTASS